MGLETRKIPRGKYEEEEKSPSKFPMRREPEKGTALDKMMFTREAAREAQELNESLRREPQQIGNKKADTIESLAAALRVEVRTRADERKILDTLSARGFKNLSSHEGVTFLKENY